MAATENIQLNVTGNANQQLQQIQKNVQKVNTQFQEMGNGISKLNSVFARLQGLLVGGAVVQFGLNMLKAADDVADLSAAIGVSIAEIRALGIAFQQNGGNVEDARMAYIKLSKSVEEARSGSEETRKKFEELGVTQEMLARNNLSEIMNQTIIGLGRLGQSTQGTAYSMELLGKKNSGLDLKKTAEDTAKLVEEQRKLEPYILKQAELWGNLEKISTKFTGEITKESAGLVGMLVSLTENTDRVAKSLALLVTTAINAAAIFGLYKIALLGTGGALNALQVLFTGTIIRKVEDTAVTTANTVATVANTTAKTANAAATVAQGAATVATTQKISLMSAMFASTGANLKSIKNMFTGLMQGFKGLISIVPALVGIFLNFDNTTGKISKSMKTVTASMGIFRGAWTVLTNVFKGGLQVIFSTVGILGKVLTIFLRFANVIGIVTLAFQVLNEAIRFLTGSSLVEWIDRVIKKFTGFSIIDWVSDKVSWLTEKFQVLLKMMGLADDKAPAAAGDRAGGGNIKNGEYNTAPSKGTGTGGEAETEKAQGLRKAIEDITAAYQKQAKERVASLQLEFRLLGMSEDAAELERAKVESLKEQQNALAELDEKEKEILADQKLSDATRNSAIATIRKQRDEIRATGAEERINSENAIKNIQAYRLEQEKLINDLEIKKVAMDNKQSLKNLQDELSLVGLYGDALQDRQTQLAVEQELQGKLLAIEQKRLELDQQRKKIGEDRFRQEMAHLTEQENEARNYAGERLKGEKAVTDAQRALRNNEKQAVGQRLEELARSVDPAVLAVKQLDSVFGNMESAIDNFVKTGKFSFKDFARSVIQDIIAIQLKAAATKIFNSVVSSIFGLAEGGPATAGKPYIVGEEGPELFVPKSSGNVIPNDKVMGKGGVNVGSASGSVNNTYITNNISALDAKSVAQLFAENRRTLFGAVEMAKKETPYRTV